MHALTILATESEEHSLNLGLSYGIGFLTLGWVASLVVARRIAERDHPARTTAAFLPWAAVATVILVAAAWTMAQPMAMRGSMMGM